MQPSTPDAPSGAPAPQGGGGGGGFGGGGITSMLFLLLPIVLILFMMRSQSKKQKQIESSLKVGDRVGTRGGAIGKIVKVGDRTVELELAPGVTVAFRKDSIEGQDVDPKKADDKKSEKADDKKVEKSDDKSKDKVSKDKS